MLVQVEHPSIYYCKTPTDLQSVKKTTRWRMGEQTEDISGSTQSYKSIGRNQYYKTAAENRIGTWELLHLDGRRVGNI